MKKTILFIIFLSAITLQAIQVGNNLKTAKKVIKLMGTRFELIAVTPNDTLSWKGINAGIDEIKRIEKIISSWDPESQTSEVNRNAGIKPVKVDDELFELIRRSKKISILTVGVFDISYASLDKIWKFDGSMKNLPTKEQMQESVSKINFENIILDEQNRTVFLKEKGMKIGFGAIGKGFAANRAKLVMQSLGIVNGVVNASGDLITWGRQADGTEWKVGITDPDDKSKVFSWLNISGLAVVTSATYEKFVEIDGVRYGHIINPLTGMPATGLKSVTIICPDTELADALATSTFILGEKDGLDLINSLKGIECILVNEQGEFITSNNLQLNLYELSNTENLEEVKR